MYLALRHQITRNYNSENFIDRLQKEVNGVITDLNQTTEMNVQIISHESEKLKKLEKKVEERIAEMQQIYTLLDSRDSRYQEILDNARRIQKTPGHPADPSKAYRKASAPRQHGDPGATSIQSRLTSPGIHETDIHETQVNMTEPSPETQADAPVQIPEHTEGDSDNDNLTPREKVMGYYHQGRELDDIAARTGLPLGEVELIIELHK
ncbi:hypothetical protein L21SP2_1207 [Salinispira pacifica]|uniref:Uncharacterized protein n=2 Tax=Salinispira pacifica TaxID=1307761 RepID=V5WFQ2_9SPIO|nr:hypothetical protein L21SP2_1207 [Salinispira pacifica]